MIKGQTLWNTRGYETDSEGYCQCTNEDSDYLAGNEADMDVDSDGHHKQGITAKSSGEVDCKLSLFKHRMEHVF